MLFEGDSEIEQLYKIFSLLGSPSNDVMQIINENQPNFKLAPLPQWKSIKISDVFNDPAVLLDSMFKAREKAFNKLLELKYILGFWGIDLL